MTSLSRLKNKKHYRLLRVAVVVVTAWTDATIFEVKTQTAVVMMMMRIVVRFGVVVAAAVAVAAGTL